ncbi:MAG TPA: aldehyde dehydrogenase family protein [Novosphingobium sp.]
MPEIKNYRNLIGGELRAPSSGKYLDSINPATGQVWARVPAGNKDDIDAAVAAARAAQPAWAAMPGPARAHIMRQIGQIFMKHGEEIARMETTDNGRLLGENVQRAGIGMAYVWDNTAGLTLEASIGRSAVLENNMMGFTRREPYGVIAAIVPWNAPVAMTCGKASLALAGGNTVVVKPPEQASVAVLRFAELLAEVVPPGVINIVCGEGPDAGEPLVSHPGINKISMTGSSVTGKRIQAAAAPNLTSAIFELGGKSPNIVLEDADLDAAAEGVSTGAIFTGNAGQVCVAGSRILVQRNIMDDLLQRIRAITEKIVVGDPFDARSCMGPIVSQKQFERVTGFIEAGKRDAELVFGGRYGDVVVPSMPGGYWVEPTLFRTEDNSLSICQEEIFGPVAVMIPFDTDDQAIAIANDVNFGLASGLWTRNLSRAHRYIREIQAGSVWVNTYRQPRLELPFGGYKQSGYGHDDIYEYTREKSAIINPI